MRFGIVHRVMVDLLAVIGVLSLVTSGELGKGASIAVMLALAGALAVPEKWPKKHVMTIAPLALFGFELLRLVRGASVLQVAVEFALALQIVRLATRKGAAQDAQVIILAWLHLVAGTVFGGGIAYAFCLVGFLIVAPGALVLSHLRREVEGNYRQGARDRSGLPVDVPRILRSKRVVGKPFLVMSCLTAVPILVFTFAVFMMFPRVGLSLLLLRRPQVGRVTGFSERVDLGGTGSLQTDPAIVLRVEASGLPEPPPTRLSLYLRGTALDAYDGRTWTRTPGAPVTIAHHGQLVPIVPDPVLTNRTLSIDLEPIDPTVIFLPAGTVAIRVKPRGEPLLRGAIEVQRGADDVYQYAGLDQRGIAYEAYLAPSSESQFTPLPPSERQRYLRLGNTSERVLNLAQQWVAGASTDLDAARSIDRRLRTEYRYDLASPSGQATDPLEDFLFVSKRGHCEYFSTAMAVMLRAVGVPSRNITGFSSGTYNRFGHYYSVRESDAHSWVEANLTGLGWERFDPTPGTMSPPPSTISGLSMTMREIVEAVAKTWDQRVIRYDLQQQLWLLGGAKNRLSVTSESLRRSVTAHQPNLTRKHVVFAFSTIFVIGAGIAIWRLRHFRLVKTRIIDAQPPELIEATALYRSLDSAMTRAGIPRIASTPPRRHARALSELAHPLASDVAEITERYLRARFGADPITPAERLPLAIKVRTVRTFVPMVTNRVSQSRADDHISTDMN